MRSFWKFEELISTTIEETKDIPEIISETGKIGMPHKGVHLRVPRLHDLFTPLLAVGQTSCAK